MNRFIVAAVAAALSIAVVGCDSGSNRGGGWNLSSKPDEISGSTDEVLSLFSSDAGLVLQVRCMRGGTNVALVRSGKITDQDTAVTETRFDDAPSSASAWDTLMGHEGLQYVGDADAFIRELGASSVLRVRIQSPENGAIDATFHPAGLFESMKPVPAVCGWNRFLPDAAPSNAPSPQSPAPAEPTNAPAVSPPATAPTPPPSDGGNGFVPDQPANNIAPAAAVQGSAGGGSP